MRRVPELDGLRGLAVLSVIACHTEYFRALMPRTAQTMQVGVDLFFVLSGFLITGIILGNRGDRHFYRNFYARRALRIWPVYYLLLIVAYLAGGVLWGPGSAITRGDLLHLATFTQSVPFGPMILQSIVLGVTWSLAVEEQFYIVWPPLVRRFEGWGLTGVIAAMVALSVASRSLGVNHFQFTARCDGIALGSLMALILAGRKPDASRESRLIPWLTAVGIVGLAMPFAIRLADVLVARGTGLVIPGTVKFSLDLLGFNLAATCLVGFCACRTGRPLLAPLRNRALRYVGTISYGLYLFHIPTFMAFAHLSGQGQTPTLLVTALGIMTTLVISVASWHLFERPILDLKDRFVYQTSVSEADIGLPDTPSEHMAEPLEPRGTVGSRL